MIDLITTIKNCLAFIFIGLGVLAVVAFDFFKKGQKSIKNKENEEAANSVRKYNRIKKNVIRLSGPDLDNEVQKWKDARDGKL